MQTSTYSQAFLQRRKLLLFLPVLTIPFITILFGLLIAQKSKSEITSNTVFQGLKVDLPEAIFNNKKVLNKMSYYEQADRDSAELKEMIEKDPYYQSTLASSKYSESKLLIDPAKQHQQSFKRGMGYSKYKKQDPNELMVQHKLHELDQILRESSEPKFDNAEVAYENNIPERISSPQEVNGMLALMNEINSESEVPETDPEMSQLEGMLDKILAIQNPEIIHKKEITKSNYLSKASISVLTQTKVIPITILDTIKKDNFYTEISNPKGFYSINGFTNEAQFQNIIKASFAESQIIIDGSIVKIKLDQDVAINGIPFPKGEYVFGKAELKQDRIHINIENIRNGNNLSAVKLTVFDLDGLEGIQLPSSVYRDVGKQSTARTFQGLNIPIIDQSIGAQAANAGIDVAKNMIGRKTKQLKVSVKSGYQILLKNQQF